jgi:hypothetical protein
MKIHFTIIPPSTLKLIRPWLSLLSIFPTKLPPVILRYLDTGSSTIFCIKLTLTPKSGHVLNIRMARFPPPPISLSSVHSFSTTFHSKINSTSFLLSETNMHIIFLEQVNYELSIVCTFNYLLEKI